MKKLLVLSFFPAFTPPASGGELRLVNMYRQLSQYFDIAMVSWTYPQCREEIVQHNEHFREYRVPKSKDFDEVYDALFKAGIQGELSGVACAMVGRNQTRYHKIVASLFENVDGVIHEFPYTVPYDITIGCDAKPRFYNSHNFESEMICSLVSGGGCDEVFKFVWQLENTLIQSCQGIFATSQSELHKFRFLYNIDCKKIFLAPNGYDPEEFEFSEADRVGHDRYKEPFVLFFGSQHPPSIEAANYIVEELATQLPQQRFVIAGRVGLSISKAPGNVQLLGEVSAAEKRFLFATASVFINPMFSGAGTCLKTIEALAAGLPLVTTSVGARGLGIINEVHGLVAERDTFMHALLRVLQDNILRQRLSKAQKCSLVTDKSWPAIVKNIIHTFERALGQSVTQGEDISPTPALILNDYSVANPVAGGAKRLYNLLLKSGQQRPIVLLCLHDKVEIEAEELAPNFVEMRIPKSNEQRILEQAINSVNWISINDIASGMFCISNNTLVRYYRALSRHCGVKVFSHPYLAPLLEVPTAVKPVIYDSHNVEAGMKRDILAPHTDGELLSQFVNDLENYLLDKATAISCVTQKDAEHFAIRANEKRIQTILNGSTPLSTDEAKQAMADRSARDIKGRFIAIFIGSGHPPNVAAAQFLCRIVLPQFPTMTLLMVGAVCNALGEFAKTSGLRRMGVVSDAQKHELLLQADIALNPMAEGGGSNLKIADYFSYALPTVSTVEGIRGFSVHDNEHAIISPQVYFIEAIKRVVADSSLRGHIAVNAYKFAVENLDWCRLGQQYADFLQSNTLSLIRNQRKTRMLVVTYRFTEPSQGGAEEYLVRFLQKYVEYFDVQIDLVAPAVQWIFNEYHFCCSYQANTKKPGQHFAPFLRHVKLFPDTPLPTETKQNYSQVLWEQRLFEQIGLGRQAADVLTDDCLLGGWYFLEIHSNGQYARWSSEQAEIFTTANTGGLRLYGVRATPCHIEIYIDDILKSTLEIQHNFNIEFALEPGKNHIISLRVPAFEATGDSRKLGFLLQCMQILHIGSSVWTDFELDRSFSTLWREQDCKGFINALQTVACQRPDDIEKIFHAVRGPRSKALVDYVQSVANNYDFILVQGVPFSLSVDVAPVIKKSKVPMILLPHLHVDDDFYHWRQYYDLYKMSDAVISFSTTVSDSFLKPLGAKTVELNGGGGEPMEFLCHKPVTDAFKAIHASERPYFLVLGRKTGAKGYRTIIMAQQILMKTLDIDLVIIGHDEDKLPITEKNVYYYGAQDRSVVISALASCVAVVNMSSSESFGIVLVEGWMSQRPVIANRNCLSFNELVNDGTDGRLVTDVKELCEAMRDLIENPEKAKTMGQHGYTKAINRLTWDNIAISFHESVQNILRHNMGPVTKSV